MKYDFVRINQGSDDIDFSYDHYKRLISFIKNDRPIYSFRDCAEMGIGALSRQTKYLILRHDIEVSVERALQLGEIDHSFGVNSSFFFLLSGEYNIFERDQAMRVRELIRMGHDIGVHYDAALLKEMGADSELTVQNQIYLLESYFGIKVRAISCHMPMRAGATVRLDGVIDTYDEPYFKDIKYLSDSNQKWREGEIKAVIARHEKVQLLLHENTWSKHGLSFESILFDSMIQDFDERIARTKDLVLQMHDGLRRRAAKDAEFRKKFK